MKTQLCLNRRGQALIESLVVSVVLSVLLMGSLSTLYVCFSKLWLRHFTHEAVICMASEESLGSCQKQLIKNMHAVLPFGRLMVDEFNASPHLLSVRTRWSFGMHDSLPENLTDKLHIRLKEHQELVLPLRGRVM